MYSRNLFPKRAGWHNILMENTGESRLLIIQNIKPTPS
jgi:hypothetical protein